MTKLKYMLTVIRVYIRYLISGKQEGGFDAWLTMAVSDPADRYFKNKGVILLLLTLALEESDSEQVCFLLKSYYQTIFLSSKDPKQMFDKIGAHAALIKDPEAMEILFNLGVPTEDVDAWKRQLSENSTL